MIFKLNKRIKIIFKKIYEDKIEKKKLIIYKLTYFLYVTLNNL